MLDLALIEVDEVATALADQTDDEHRWLFDPRSGQVAFWTTDAGIDGQNPVELDEIVLIPIDPIPSYPWYQHMADFAAGITDRAAGERLADAPHGRGRFAGSRTGSMRSTRRSSTWYALGMSGPPPRRRMAAQRESPRPERRRQVRGDPDVTCPDASR